MSIIRYATLCDRCGEVKSDEYTAWPTCRECSDDVCPNCAAEAADDETNRTICKLCAQLYASSKG